MKLIIQNPCLNEAKYLPQTLHDLPRQVGGFDAVEWLVGDDGSADDTSAVAKQHAADYVVRLPYHHVLARAFMIGMEVALRAGADVIINTDADNQYDASCIPDLVAPILDGRAQMVIGERPIDDMAHFSLVKRKLQRLAVKIASGAKIPDATSGFRAIHREAAIRIYVFNSFTYTLETIMQTSRKDVPVMSVPIRVHGETRPSRLFKSTSNYIW